MFGFLKTLFQDDKARKAPEAKPAPKPKPAPPPVLRGAAAAKPAAPRQATGQDRAQLLKHAAEVHRAKRKILDALSDEDRAKLLSMAILAFLNEGREPPDKR
ncbi:conserved hypothetical protein [Candidatus Terasakiella magnetica]|nr:conserved hypothetical protein [Candidatus Terasakiella magnetica]